jgi:hypothetical protein
MVRMKANRRVLKMLWASCLIVVSSQFNANGGQDHGPQQTWQGFITDTHCGTNCQVTKDMIPDKACVRRCVRNGSKYGLWVEHRVYELEPQDKAAGFAATNVTVTGWLEKKTIHIDSIKPVKRT